MISPQSQILIHRAEESHQAARVLLDTGFPNSLLRNHITHYFI
jgi:hypothetical protein